MRRREGLFIALAAAFLITSLLSLPASGGDIPYWPSEQEERLGKVESEVLDLQRQLAAARREKDAKDVKKLEKKFKSLQEERIKLLRATGALR